MRNVRSISIRLLWLGLLALIVTSLHAVKLTVVDTEGISTDIYDARIYYTSRDGSMLSIFYTPDVEHDGIRIKRGKSSIMVYWTSIEKVQFEDDNNVTLMMQNGKHFSEYYISPSADGLVGESELGEYMIRFDDIRSISVRHDTTTEKGTDQ